MGGRSQLEGLFSSEQAEGARRSRRPLRDRTGSDDAGGLRRYSPGKDRLSSFVATLDYSRQTNVYFREKAGLLSLIPDREQIGSADH